MAVITAAQKNCENRKIPNQSLTGIKPDLCHKCELEYTFANVRIEKIVEMRYNFSAGAIPAKSVWQDFVLVFRKC